MKTKRIAIILVALLLLGGCANRSNTPDGYSVSPNVGIDEGTFEHHYDLGLHYLSEGNYQEAILAFTAAIEIDPKRVEAYVGRGNACIFSGETEENLTLAQADYETALELDDLLAEAWLGLIDVYIRRGEVEAALELAREGYASTENEDIFLKLKELEEGYAIDSGGRERRMSYYESGTLSWYHEYTYDEKGLKRNVASFDSSGNQTGSIELQYDDAMREIVGYGWRGDTGAVTVIEQEYGEANRPVKTVWYDESGAIESITTAEYNAQGDQIESAQYYPDGSLYLRFTYEYNGAGELVKNSTFDKDGALVGYVVSEYNEHGARSKQSMYDEDGTLTEYNVYLFDESGENIGWESYDSGGMLISTEIWRYS